MDDDFKLAELEPEEKPELVRYSFSKFRNQAECSARIYFAKLAREGKITEDFSLPLVYGSAAHKGFEDAVRDGKDPFKTASDYVQEHLLDKFNADVFSEKDLKKMNERLTHMNRCIENWRNNFYRNLVEDNVEIEVKIEIPWRKGTLVGIIDAMKPEEGIWKDWKTGMKLPYSGSYSFLRDAQAPVYYRLAQAAGFAHLPHKFDYVYLMGQNDNRIETEYKSGAKKGQKYSKADKDNPMMKFHWSVYQDDDKVERIFKEFVLPLAKEYENKVYVKKPSDMACASCLYRTACKDMVLPDPIDGDTDGMKLK